MLSQGEYTKLNKARQLLEWNRTTVPTIRVAILSTIYHVINNTVILLIHTRHLFHHATLLHQNLSEDRSVRQLRAATEEFQSWFGPALLAEKVQFDIIPYRKIWFRFEPWPSFSINHHATILCTYDILSRFIHTKAAHGKRNLAVVTQIVERLPRCSRNSLFANKKTYPNS